jgi:hypothetical protein
MATTREFCSDTPTLQKRDCNLNGVIPETERHL